MKLLQPWSVAGVLGMLVVCVGCGAENGAGPSASENVTSQDDALSGHHRHSATPTPTTSTVATPTASGGAPATPTAAGGPAASSASTPSASTATDVASIVAAAQTPDGMAIPEAAGPGGQCPPVVVALGFWACPTAGQTCSFTTGSARHDCTCVRTQGEGQTPSWICN